MLSEVEIFDFYSQYGIVQGGELYLPLTEARNFLAECKENNLAVIGIEGFLYKNKNIIPQIDIIADYSLVNANSWTSYKNICNECSESFLRDINPKDELVVNFVVLSEIEWNSWCFKDGFKFSNTT